MTLNRPVPTLDQLIQVVRSQNPEEERMMVGDIMQIFRSQNLVAQRQLIEQCPSFPMKSQLLELLDLDNQSTHINTLSIVAIAYSAISPLELGVIFGQVGFNLANDYRQNLDYSLNEEILWTALSQSVLGASVALSTLGQYEKLLEFSEVTLECLEQGSLCLESRTDERSKAMVHANLDSVRLYSIEAYIQCQRYKKAQELVEIQKQSIDRMTKANQYKFENLQVSLNTFTIPPAVFSSEPAVSTEDQFLAILQQLDLFVEMMADWGEKNPGDRDKMMGFIREISDIKTSIETRSITFIEAGACLANLMERFSSISEIQQIRQTMDTVISVFLDPNIECDSGLIEQSLATLQAALQWTRDNHFLEEEAYALWGLSICYRQQEKLQSDPTLQKEFVEKSVEMLLALRKNIELIRSRIVDPEQRVYWINCYVRLFPILCEQLYRLDRPLDLLNAIEGAKGRVLADVLTQKNGQPISDFDFSASVKQLPTLMKQVGAHYLTYLVDDEETFAVLVAKDGSIKTHSVAIGKTQLNQWLSDDDEDKNPLDARNWGRKINMRERLPNLPERLAPFVSWLKPYAESGVIQPNDHLCYSPDESLHLIPLHCLSFLDQPLACYVSVSRIHGGAALVELLKYPPEKPSRLTAVYVPAKEDLNNPKGSGPQKLANMRATADWLKDTKKMPTTIAYESTADLATVLQLPFTQSLVHFSTHGVFPSENQQNQGDATNPYHNSGLVLAKDGELPENVDGEGGSLLNPEAIIEGNLNFAGSHVTMQACVSGKAKEGIGGDAIGLDWALMLAKASSLLSTHWNVGADDARQFSDRFYQYWLFENNYTRAQAWQRTVRDLMDNQEKSFPYYWAAFSLSGDWR